MFLHHEPTSGQFRRPAPACIPRVEDAELCALYAGARVGGDFFEFFDINDSLIFVLLDVAGRREEALHIASAVQDFLRDAVPKEFASPTANPAEALVELAIAVNTTVLAAAGGVRHCPGFFGCYDPPFGTLTYVNAGHVPALMRAGNDITELPANGLPLGLFSHVTRDAQFCFVPPGGAFLLVSRGVVEARLRRREFGTEGLKTMLTAVPELSAQAICEQVLERTRAAAKIWGISGNQANDRTVVALVRRAAAASAAAT